MVAHKENANGGLFYIEKNNEKIAEMSYLKQDGDTLEIDHTEVNEEERGNKLGEDLVSAAVSFARENNKKIIATCSFAKAVFERKGKEWADVLQ